MKTFYNIIIIIFVAMSLFVVKDDAVVAFNKIYSFAEENYLMIKEMILLNSKEEYNANRNEFGDIYTEGIVSGESLPGPLSVYGNLLEKDIHNINLEKDNIILSTNNQRKNNGGLIPLDVNSKLNLSASEKVDDMFLNNYFEHVSPSGVGVTDLGKMFDYDYILMGENLAMGNFKDEDFLVEAWMSSEGHRANILNSKYTEIGVSAKKGILNGKEVWIAVQHFGVPREACPSVSDYLRGLINIQQKEVSRVEEDLIYKKANIDSGIISEKGETRNEQIVEYNELVNTYNQMVADLKNKISDYNDQVARFNFCVGNYTAE